jgi:SAM-dependent methyltransferase
MSDRTLVYYETHSAELASRYESVDMRDAHERLAATLPAGARLLELGCGTGRDAAALLALGYDIRAIDGSAAMLAEAVRLHPPLAGRLVRHQMPRPLPFADATFDAVLAFASLMHLPEPSIAPVLREAARVLVSRGRLVFSVCTTRPGVGPDGVDADGRRFTLLAVDRWRELAIAAGFDPADGSRESDRQGRDGVVWSGFSFLKRA